jgi:hypothetical protein
MFTRSRILPAVARRGQVALIGLLLLPFVLAPRAARAIEPAEVAAIGGLVLQIIGGIATWIDDQSDDTAAAVVAAAWGTDCSLKKRECKDTGFFWAECNETAENACGKGEGYGYSYEGPFGLAKEITVKSKSTVFALHGVPSEKHSSKGYSLASIDGNSRADTEAESLRFRLREDWPAGTVLAVATLDTVRLSAPSGASASGTFRGSVKVDGQEVWSATATLDGDGGFSTTGPIPASAFTVSFDGADHRWNALLTGYVFEFPVDTLAALLEGETRDVHLHMDMDAQCETALEGDGYPPPPTIVGPDDLRLNDGCGVPLLNGQLVSVSDPAGLFLCAAPPSFGPFLDTDVFGLAAQSAFGILDPWQPAPDLPPGTRVQVRGMVTQHDGRTVLTESQLIQDGAGNSPPPIPLTIAQALQQAEALEGMPVVFQGARIIGGDAWPPSGEGAMVLITDPSGLQLPVVIGGWTGVGGGQPPYAPFTIAGIWSQQDPDGLLPCFFSGYLLRVRGSGDIVSGVPTDAGTPGEAIAGLRVEPIRPNPMRGGTGTLRITLPRMEEWVSVSIHAPSGRLVRNLFQGSLSAGIHEVHWDGEDESGRRIPSGVYFTRVQTRTGASSQKLLLLE